MKIYVVLKYEYLDGKIDSVTVIDSYQNEQDAKAFCVFENKFIDESEEYVCAQSELY